jgi:hypothetical protein
MSEEQGVEDLTTVSGQLLGRLADAAPDVANNIISNLPAEQQEAAQHAVSTGRWFNRVRS